MRLVKAGAVISERLKNISDMRWDDTKIVPGEILDHWKKQGYVPNSKGCLWVKFIGNTKEYLFPLFFEVE